MRPLIGGNIMKKILGKILVFIILLTSFSEAAYRWEVSVDKRTYYQKEAFLATFTCQFDDRSPDMFIEFNPKAEGFVFEKLDFNNRIYNAKRVSTYRYFVKALNPGEMRLSVEALMRQTTDDSIKETVLGRDNDQDIVFNDTKVKIKKIALNILPLPAQVELVGSFEMEVSFSKKRLKVFEPLQLKIKISGNGDFNHLKPFAFSLKDGKVFTQKAEKHYKLTEKGYEGYLIWRYAMTSEHDFKLKSQEINYFDTKSKRLKKLVFEGHEIIVDAKTSQSSQVDSVTFPPQKQAFDWKKLLNNSLYFLFGAFFVLIIDSVKKALKKGQKATQRFKSLNDLLNYLIESRDHEELLREIEDDMRKKKLKSFNFYLNKLPKELRA